MMAAHTKNGTRDRAKPVELVPRITDGILPPHSLKAEASVLGALLLDSHPLEKLGFLRAEHFYHESHRVIFEAIGYLSAKGSKIDVVTVGTRIRDENKLAAIGGGLEMLVALLDVNVRVDNIEDHARIVYEKARKRKLIAAAQLIEAKARLDADDFVEVAGFAYGQIQEVSNDLSEILFEGASAIMADSADEDDAAFIVPALQIGPGRPAILGGDSYTGKSVIAADLAISVAAGKSVFGVFHVEDTGVVRWLNYDQNPKLARRRLRRVARAKGVQQSELTGRLEMCHFPDLHLDDEDAEGKLNRIFRGAKLGIIDALIGAVDHTPEKDEAMGKLLHKLMRVSSRTGCTFVVIHHTIKPPAEFPKKKGEKPRPVDRSASASLRGNRAIFGAADSVLMLISTGKKKPVRVIHDKAPNDGNTLDDFYLTFVDQPEPATLLEDNQPNPKWGLRVVHLEAEHVEREVEDDKPDPADEDRRARAAFDQIIPRVVEVLKGLPGGASGRQIKKLLPRVNHELVDLALQQAYLQKLAAFDGGEKRGQKKIWRAV